jgi:hypothetical protein
MNKFIDDIVRAVLNIEHDNKDTIYTCVGCSKITKYEEVLNICDSCEDYFCDDCMDSFGQLCFKCIDELYPNKTIRMEDEL